MTPALVLHQLRFDVLATRRNRRAQLFIVALPLVLLVTFAGLYGTDTVEVAGGHEVAGNRASVPGIMGLAVLTESFVALTMTVVAQREAGILKRRRATPVPALVLIASRGLTALLSSAAACALLVVVARVAYDIEPPTGFWPVAALVVVVGSLCWACVGYAVSGLVTSPEGSGPIVQLVMLPLQLISGIYFPADGLPDWLQHVAAVFPLVHLTDALQHAFLPGGAQVAWADLGVMALWTVGAALIAARTFSWLPKTTRG
jgi:ABC-2 type transport system permease protein